MTQRIVYAVLAFAFIVVAPASAQQANVLGSKVIAQRVDAIFQAVLAERDLPLQDTSGKPVVAGARANRILADPEVVRAAYEEALARLVLDPEVQRVVFAPDA